MKPTIFIGIDNGVTGSIGVIHPKLVTQIPMPTFSELSYTKQAKNITRINTVELLPLLIDIAGETPNIAVVFLERPMVNPKRWDASVSALRALEATLIVIERAKLSYRYIDSREWQKVLLPAGIEGAPNLKRASIQIAKRLYPHANILSAKDADGLLIAEYARRQFV